ncbi:MAG: flippase [Candidatus Komeilibacteria bacterium]
MSLTKKVAYNTIVQFVGKLISTVIGVAIVALITRHLGQVGYGQYTTALVFAQFFAVIIDLGLYIVLIQEISDPQTDTRRAVSNIFTIRLLSAAIVFVAAPLVALLFPYDAIVKQSIILMSISFFFFTLAQVLVALYQKHLQMDRVIIAEVLGRLVFLLSIVLFVVLQKGLLYIVAGNIIFNIIYFIIIFIKARGYTHFGISFDWLYWGRLWHRLWPIALTSLLTLVYFRADTLILSVYRPVAEVGIYGATYKVLEIIGTFPHMFLGLILPILTAAYVGKNLERFHRVYQKVFDFFLTITIPLIAGSLLLGERVMVLIAGPEFFVSGVVLKILIWATAFIFFGNLFGYIILAIDKQKAMIPYYIITAVLSLVLYFIFIPRYSYWAAAWSTVIIELLYMIFALIVCYRYAQIRLSLRLGFHILLATFGMSIVIKLLFAWPLWWLLLVAIIAYFAILYISGGIRPDILAELTNKQSDAQ